MIHQKLCSIAAIATLIVFSLNSAIAGESAEVKISRAQSAAPAAISADATVMDGDGTILREGSNGWTCMPDTMPGDGAPMCNDAIWMEMMGAVGAKADFKASGVGISYMLQGDKGAGVSNSDPYHPDPKNADDYVETGPHLMIVVPRELLEGMPTSWCRSQTNRKQKAGIVPAFYPEISDQFCGLLSAPAVVHKRRRDCSRLRT
jgi:hypothetical protein